MSIDRSIYNHYFTGSDVTIYLSYPPTKTTVQIDKAIGIGYNHSMSKMPVYGLGNINPLFFTRGNSLVQGNIDIAFQSTKYLKAGINHILGKKSLNEEKTRLLAKMSKNPTEAEATRLAELQSLTITDMSSVSISSILNEFEIIIQFSNANSLYDGENSSIILEGVTFVSESKAVSSSEESIIVDRISFMAKNIRG